MTDHEMEWHISQEKEAKNDTSASKTRGAVFWHDEGCITV